MRYTHESLAGMKGYTKIVIFITVFIPVDNFLQKIAGGEIMDGGTLIFSLSDQMILYVKNILKVDYNFWPACKNNNLDFFLP